MICSIEGCGRPVFVKSRALCNPHYRRWQRHGDPVAGLTMVGEPERFYREVVLAYDGDECLIWPYGKTANGYAVAYFNGDCDLVHRIVCDERHGPAPTPDHEAAHSCGHGHLACVTKRHLDWKTRAENQADRILHGTSNRGERHGMSKLTSSAVRDIREDVRNQQAIAAAFGISHQHVSAIINRKAWRNLS